MKKIYNLLLLFLLIQNFSSCKQQTLLDFEKDVMCEILPALMDSLAIDKRLMIPPPVAKAIFDKNNNRIELDSSDLDIRRKDFEEQVIKIKQDTNVVFAIQDFAYTLNDEDWNSRNTYFKNIEFKKDSMSLNTKHKIDITCVTNIKLKYKSEFPGLDENLNGKFDFNLGGLLSVSHIYFDKEKQYGILSASYFCGTRCGRGSIIYLRKFNEKWIIQKIIRTWIT